MHAAPRCSTICLKSFVVNMFQIIQRQCRAAAASLFLLVVVLCGCCHVICDVCCMCVACLLQLVLVEPWWIEGSIQAATREPNCTTVTFTPDQNWCWYLSRLWHMVHQPYSEQASWGSGGGNKQSCDLIIIIIDINDATHLERHIVEACWMLGTQPARYDSNSIPTSHTDVHLHVCHIVTWGTVSRLWYSCIAYTSAHDAQHTMYICEHVLHFEILCTLRLRKRSKTNEKTSRTCGANHHKHKWSVPWDTPKCQTIAQLQFF